MLQSPAVATLVVGIGYIGSRLVQELLYQGREVVGIDNLFSSDRRAIEAFSQSPGFRFVEGSIVDPTTIDRAVSASAEIDVVYLLAAQASANPDAASPEYTEYANLRGPRVVLDGLLRRPGERSDRLRQLPPSLRIATALFRRRDDAVWHVCRPIPFVQVLRGKAHRNVRGDPPATRASRRLGLTYGVARC